MPKELERFKRLEPSAFDLDTSKPTSLQHESSGASPKKASKSIWRHAIRPNVSGGSRARCSALGDASRTHQEASGGRFSHEQRLLCLPLEASGVFPGFAEAAICKGQLVFQNLCGFTEKSKKQKMSERTLFRGCPGISRLADPEV